MQTIPPPTASEFAASPEWHLHRLDAEASKALVVRVDEALLREASFLDGRIEAKVSAGFWFNRDQLDTLVSNCNPGPGRPALIFHIGHCGSTLISRALAADPSVLPIREPLSLRFLADSFRRGMRKEEFEKHLKCIMAALGRSFGEGQMPLVKATSTCSNIATRLLEDDGDRRAVLMYASLEAHLGNMLGRSNPMTDLKGFLSRRMADWQAVAKRSPVGFDEDSEIHLAVISWLTGMQSLLAAHRAHPAQTRLVDFDRFLENAPQMLAELNDFLGLGADPARLEEAWPAIASGYSKQPETAFDAADRELRLQRARTQKADEQASGIHWAASLIVGNPAFSSCARYLR